jgi:hypothetical protein
VHFLTLLVPIAQQPRQAGVLCRLSVEKTKPAIKWKIELKWIPGCRLSNSRVSSSPWKRGHFIIKARKKIGRPNRFTPVSGVNLLFL